MKLTNQHMYWFNENKIISQQCIQNILCLRKSNYSGIFCITQNVHFQFHKKKIFQFFGYSFWGFFLCLIEKFSLLPLFFLALFLLSECQHLCLKFCFLDYLPFITTQKIDFYVTAIKIDKNRLL